MSRLLGALAALSLIGLVASASTPLEVDRALEIQSTLALEHPGDAEVQNDLGNLLLLDGRLEEAEEAYRRALELDDSKVSSRFNLAVLLQNRGANLNALRHYREVIDQQPDHAWAHYQAGILYQGFGLQKKAVRSFSRAFEIDRSLSEPAINPHVIENPLYTQAMMRLYRSGIEDPSPPRSYDDPTRIAGLLVPEIEQPLEGNQVEDEVASSSRVIEELEATEHRSQASYESSEEETEELGESSEGGRVLTEASLEELGAANQASPPSGGPRSGTASRGSSTRGGQRSRGRATSSEGRGAVVPTVRLPTPPSRQSESERGGSTRTTGRSTGQLEIDLVPVRAG